MDRGGRGAAMGARDHDHEPAAGIPGDVWGFVEDCPAGRRIAESGICGRLLTRRSRVPSMAIIIIYPRPAYYPGPDPAHDHNVMINGIMAPCRLTWLCHARGGLVALLFCIRASLRTRPHGTASTSFPRAGARGVNAKIELQSPWIRSTPGMRISQAFGMRTCTAIYRTSAVDPWSPESNTLKRGQVPPGIRRPSDPGARPDRCQWVHMARHTR